MRLWIDGQCLQTPSRQRGIGRHVTGLLRAIADNHLEVELMISFNAAMPEEALLAREAVSGFIDRANIHVWHGAATSGEVLDGHTPERRLSEFAIAHHVNCLAPDVALSASPFEGAQSAAVPLLPDRGCEAPIASIFYDALPCRYPGVKSADRLMWEFCRRRLDAHSGFADNLCTSQLAKAELESIHVGAIAGNMAVGVLNGPLDIGRQAPVAPMGISGAFVMHVGAMDARKDTRILARAFRHLDKRLPGNGLNLVLAGNDLQSPVDEIVSEWAACGLPPARLILREDMANEELLLLGRQARAVIELSGVEDYGFAALEAIRHGIPVVAARAGALPEVMGSDALLFDPSSPKDLANTLIRVLQDPDETAGLMKRICDRAAGFTWRRSASIAVGRLAALASLDPARHDLLNRRETIARALDLEDQDMDVAARCLALAEPSQTRRRLLVEATSTVRVDHKTGIQRVVRNICAAIAERAGSDAIERQIVFCDDGEGWFTVDGQTFEQPSKNGNASLSIGQDTFLMLDSSWEFHALHGRYLRACRLRGGEVISCLYDMVPLHAEAMCNPAVSPVFTNWFRAALANSTGFVCISRAVADELYSILEAISFPRPMKIGYWHLGADFINGAAKATERPNFPGAARPVFLMVGTLEPRKGYRVAIDAFEQLWASGVEAELVIVGKEGWGVESLIRRIRSHPEYGRRLIWHSRVDDAMLAELYQRCDVLIAASFGEGFGLPLVEAGHFGKPVIASDIPIFREVGTGAASATYFEAGSPADLAHAVRNHLGNTSGSANEGARASWPNWRESAAQLEDVVMGENWYKIYEPQKRRDYVPLGDLGHVTMTAPLPAGDRAHRLALIEGPDPVDGGRSLKVTVAVTNLSGAVWSSRGATDGTLGVFLSYRALDAQHEAFVYEAPLTAIPFVHAPGDTLYMAVTVPAKLKARGAAFVDIELVQEGVAWFGSAMRVAL